MLKYPSGHPDFGMTFLYYLISIGLWLKYFGLKGIGNTLIIH
ncbi:hypothetical protein A33Q_1936 [Indibacter alkaliphilus LW1]|uniref:Uncharacterized protein n=1 Tax=Indibacter alkaliphilus (strain CCUG 57479 / KCTC 22604 / LW1) TaxID=1189612 RepID=S2E478_INDAL|nr:hypothetical protein A33Q_1936 [Indibacter alkaliphilus LW1]